MSGDWYSTARGWKIVPAPVDTLENSTTGSIQWVYIREDEEVEWDEVRLPDGTMRVVGYTIVKKADK